MSRIVDIEPLLKKYDGMNEGTEFSPIHFINDLMALEQQPSEDTEVIKVSKGAVKARQGRFVIYDVDWLKKNFYSTEEKIYGQPKQPCEDCISRQKALDCFEQTNTRQGAKYAIETLPSVIPKYTDEEIDKAQAVEQAYVDKMVELAVEEAKRSKGKWIDFNWNDGDICRWGIKCSECHTEYKHGGEMWHNPKFCPNCGAEMEGAECANAFSCKECEMQYEEGLKEKVQKWLSSFDTSSATKCFEAVNILKERLEGEE